MREEIERTILDAAERVFAEAGFGGATMQAIAEVSGLPKANLHYYFASKEGLYRRVVERIFTIWLGAADSFETSASPEVALRQYITRKMALSRSHRHGSKVWASEVMHGAPIIQDYLETTLRDWTDSRIAVIRRWISAGQIAPIEPRWLLYMIWATTQHYADFAHQIETLNQGPLDDAQWQQATDTVCGIILRGVGLGTAAAQTQGASQGASQGAFPGPLPQAGAA
ncbi:MAG: TetR family transcriptional regulator C-terminal domain-containing protein [Pararhodobacter sp.]|nr:TetR family transcriptional regulator C-terminal domain-containing protein [Pararhodobacter sp.]